MKPDVNSLVAAEERLYALLEPAGPLTMHWGKAAAGSPGEGLRLRKFHFPRAKSPSAWGDFPGLASWSLAESCEFKHREIPERPPFPLPAFAGESSREEWQSLCELAGEALRTERAQKLVPARELSFGVSGDEYHSLLGALASRLFHPAMENAYRFLLKSRGSVFFGATPELLFRREGGLLHVPAIAGTRALSPGVPETSLRDELLASEKDRAEHEWVVDGICESLRQLGLKPKFPPAPVVLRVPRLLHLYTPITATDARAIPGERLVEALHPTPAIGGHPRDAAREFLFQNETWDRGLFSAPLLFHSASRELCLVAIRSALLTPERLHIFAGAGFVRGSTPESEWQETDKKLQVMQALLFGEAHVKH